MRVSIHNFFVNHREYLTGGYYFSQPIGATDRRGSVGCGRMPHAHCVLRRAASKPKHGLMLGHGGRSLVA